MNKTDPHLKKFQLDRIALFSDAVFAIAITLLIIEIKIPETPSPFTDEAMAHELLHSLGKFIGLLVSFFVIGRYWLFHHRLFGFVTDYNNKLLWNNLLFLLSIIIMPYSTGFFSEYWQSGLKTPLIFYVCNICFTGLMNYRLLNTVSNPKYHLSKEFQNRELVKFYKTRSSIAPLVFLFCIPVSYLSITAAYFIPFFIPVGTILVSRRYHRKHPELLNH